MLSVAAFVLQDTESSEGRSKLPGGFPVVLLHDMVDSAQVGDVVEVTGVIQQQTLGAIPNGTWNHLMHDYTAMLSSILVVPNKLFKS